MESLTTRQPNALMMRPEPQVQALGWIVEVVLTPPVGWPGPRFFAVGMETASEAEEAVLRFPGLTREDVRIARRRLSEAELLAIGLGHQAVRPFAAAPEASAGEPAGHHSAERVSAEQLLR